MSENVKEKENVEVKEKIDDVKDETKVKNPTKVPKKKGKKKGSKPNKPKQEDKVKEETKIINEVLADKTDEYEELNKENIKSDVEQEISNNKKNEENNVDKEINIKKEDEKLNIEKNEEKNNIIEDDINTKNNEQTIENQEENEDKPSKLHKYPIIITVIIAIVFILGILFSTVFALKNRTSDKIISGISVKGVDVSGLTIQEAKDKIYELVNKKLKKDIALQHGEYETTIMPEQIEAKFGIEEAVNMAYNIGRSGKLLKDNFTIINSYMSKTEITPSFSYSEEGIKSFIEGISGNLPDTVKQSSYYIDNNNLIINKGKAGEVVKEEELKNLILENIVNLKFDEETIQIPTEVKQPDVVNIQKIHEEIYKKPQDAYYTKDPFTVYPHINGVDFNMTIEEAGNLVNSDAEEITIPLKITEPQIKTNQIGSEAFPNLLATYATTFSTKNGNRTNNIRLATNKINGVVLLPGEEFSYNKIVGKRTAQAGFKPAAAYSGGKVVQELGGGICQVSSTLYNSVLRANLEIVRRSNHRFATGYCPLSTDATVSWGGPEFIFKNSRKYPIKIVASVNGGRINVEIYGCKEEVEYDVEIKSETLQIIPMKTVFRTNASLPVGTQKTVQKGHGGYKSRAYRILKLNGNVVSKTLLSTDTYAQLETIIEKN